MYEKELFKIQKEITEAVKSSAADPEAAIAKLKNLQSDTAAFATDTSPEYYNAASTIQEAIGDICLKAKKPADAEKAYIEMLRFASKLYESNKEKYDFRLGYAFYKRAGFYRTILGCFMLTPRPKVLDENQQKIYNLAESLYKNALGCTMNSAKKGTFRYVDLHVTCLSDMAVFYASVGNYQLALSTAKDGVWLDRSVYEKMDDKEHAFRLANRMNVLAAICQMMKNDQLAMETLEDSNFVLEEHEKENPVIFGVMISKNLLTLAGLYCRLESEKDKAEETYKQGLRKIEMLNKDNNGRLINDVITGYMIVGDYYRRNRRENEAKSHYSWAMKQASLMFEKTKDVKYENIVKRLKTLI